MPWGLFTDYSPKIGTGLKNAFDDLKQALPDAFEGCLRFLWGVLLQEGHPVAYESRKLSDPETRYTAQ